jgi:hypothetical protein
MISRYEIGRLVRGDIPIEVGSSDSVSGEFARIEFANGNPKPERKLP